MSPRPTSGSDPVFIVGLYKNGTSWLLSALAAHPEFSALRELDVLRSVAGRSGRHLLPPRERLANVFGRSAFCALRAEQLAPGAFHRYLPDGRHRDVASLYDLPAEAAVRTLTAMLTEGSATGGERASRGKPVGFLNFPPALLAAAFEALRKAGTPAAAMDGFLAALAPAFKPGQRLVLKGADQILCLDALREWRPQAPRVAIVRDGRDAAVSAFHYRQLMRERRMAWQHSHVSFMKPVALAREAGIRGVTALRRLAGYGEDWRLGRSLSVWADRVRRVLKAAERGELTVLRYEDLLTDFDGQFTRLLQSLGADASPATVAAVAKASSFEAQSGRPRGVAGQDVMRKGVAGEWRESLTARDRALVWRIAGIELAAMGYTRDGEPGMFSPPGTGRGI
ncbi:MAG TPA: sulfotransferase domain-containing protein [Gammaproteobacteria bacterium]|nr:sulfotransferase domain-containing protein [Gammaproteobacteria bacterium]